MPTLIQTIRNMRFGNRPACFFLLSSVFVIKTIDAVQSRKQLSAFVYERVKSVYVLTRLERSNCVYAETRLSSVTQSLP
jgi:hypothetical protein